MLCMVRTPRPCARLACRGCSSATPRAGRPTGAASRAGRSNRADGTRRGGVRGRAGGGRRDRRVRARAGPATRVSSGSTSPRRSPRGSAGFETALTRSVRSALYRATPRHGSRHPPALRPAFTSSPTPCWSSASSSHDARAVALVRARSEAGEDLPALISDAMEIGARVLEREQAEANAEFVRGGVREGLARGGGGVHREGPRGGRVLRQAVDEVFGPENGQLAKELAAAVRRRLLGGRPAPAARR